MAMEPGNDKVTEVPQSLALCLENTCRKSQRVCVHVGRGGPRATSLLVAVSAAAYVIPGKPGFTAPREGHVSSVCSVAGWGPQGQVKVQPYRGGSWG